jgi:hypothetical protein
MMWIADHPTVRRTERIRVASNGMKILKPTAVTAQIISAQERVFRLSA